MADCRTDLSHRPDSGKFALDFNVAGKVVAGVAGLPPASNINTLYKVRHSAEPRRTLGNPKALSHFSGPVRGVGA